MYNNSFNFVLNQKLIQPNDERDIPSQFLFLISAVFGKRSKRLV